MKKLLSLLMAMLMLCLPVIGMAETAEADDLSTLLGSSEQKSFTAKYLAEGQRSVTDVTIQPGIVLLSFIPEEMQAAVTDLLDALKIQVVGQGSDGEIQGALRLLLNDQTAADAILALGKDGLYVASTFLGSKIVRATPEQLQQLGQQTLQQLADQGALPAGISGADGGLDALMQDPEAVIASLIGEADPTELMTAIMALLSGATMEEVTEKPDEVVIDAAYVTIIPLQKEALTQVTTELAKFLWSMPVVQQMGGGSLTEEGLIETLNKVPGILAEDAEVRVYTTADGAQEQITSDLKLAAGDDALVKLNALVENGENMTHVLWSADVTANGQNMLEAGDMMITMTVDGGTMEYTVTASMNMGDEWYTPIQMTISTVWTDLEAAQTMDMDVLAQIQTEPDGEAIGLVFGIAADKKDLGDHAETNCVIRAAMENIGDLVAITVHSATDLAEAYITTADAVEPLSMSEEDQQNFLQEVAATAQLGLMTLISHLPESVQMQVMGAFGAQ